MRWAGALRAKGPHNPVVEKRSTEQTMASSGDNLDAEATGGLRNLQRVVLEANPKETSWVEMARCGK